MADTRRNVKISEEVYKEIRDYCKDNALKISRWIELVLKERIENEMAKKLPKS